MATGAGEGLFRWCVFEGCISCDGGIERRPYHRNCGCALHKPRGHCSHASRGGKNVSFPMRRAWSEGSLALAAANHNNNNNNSGHSSASCSSPAAVALSDVGRTQLSLCDENDDDHSVSIFKV